MKNLIMTIAVLLAATASAEQSFAIVNTVAYSAKDKSPSDDHAGYYSGYLCTVESVTTYFGGNTSAGDLTSYVSANYQTVVDALYAATKDAGFGGAIAKSGVLRLAADGEAYAAGQYAVSAYSATALGSEYLALILYDDGKNEAFRVFDWSNAEANGSSVAFDDGGIGEASAERGYGAWTSVPEPTSGLLLILGLAGLALKRRR